MQPLTDPLCCTCPSAPVPKGIIGRQLPQVDFWFQLSVSQIFGLDQSPGRKFAGVRVWLRASLGSSACGSGKNVDLQYNLRAGCLLPSKYPQKTN